MKTGDANEMRDDDVIAEIRIRCRRDGAMSVAGDIQDKMYALAMLDSARECIENHHQRQQFMDGKSVMIPPQQGLIA
jgi:hypothetical protein